MLDRVEHIALAVTDLDEAIAHYENVWGLRVSHREVVPEEGIEEAMLPIGDTYVQLVAAMSPESTVGRFLEGRGEGMHHIAYEVEDLEVSLAELKARGVRLVDERPRPGGREHMVAFVHPKGNYGLLVELIQRPGPRRRAE
jgi:methylmalonyl-CoA/ethylmalonyl-CoA epimerase